MIDGTYDVKARTPLGKRAGQLVMVTNGATCDADLSVAGKTKRLQGTIDGKVVVFEGSVHLPFPIGDVAYTLSGTVEGDVLSGTCRTKKFSFDVEGTRVA